MTIIIKLVLLPLSLSAVKSQKSLQEIQPKMDQLKKQYKDDKEKLASETMKLYKEQKVNPLSSCLPLLIQFPFLIAVYRAFRHGLNSENFDILYKFVANPEHLNPVAFGFINMAVPSIALAILAGLAQYIQTQMLTSKKAPASAKSGAKDENIMATMNKSMQYFMPFMTILIGLQLPAGLTFYWFLTTVFTSLQQLFMFKKKKESGIEIIPPQDNSSQPKTDDPATTNNESKQLK